MRVNNFFKLVIAIVVSELAGVIGSVFTISAIPNWYDGLVKPALSPPSWVFGPAWTTLYALMGVAAFLIWREYDKLTLSEVEGLVIQRKKQIKIALSIFLG
ncbi:MAG: TspO/MBR family protein, partial [Candidatus Peregrinibacteria bacterium]